MGVPIDHRPSHRWRSRHIFAALRLRRAAAQHSEPEGQLLRRFAHDKRTVVELGVAEGGSAFELREAMHPDGTLWLVDPFCPNPRTGVSTAFVVARRTVETVRRGNVVWILARSDEAADGWCRPIDFILIDGDHAYDAVARDWKLWSPHVTVGGYVAFHDARCFPQGWTTAESGPVRFTESVVDADPNWLEVAAVDSTVIFQRVLSP